MKKKKLYKKTVIFLFLIILLHCQLQKKLPIYQPLTAVCLDEKTLLLNLDNKQKQSLQQNQVIYYQNKKIEYSYQEDEWITLKTTKKICHEEVISISILTKRKTFYDILLENWRKE